jgi:hypothetical protein
MVAKLCSLDPGAMLAGVEGLLEPLEKTLTTRLKSDAVKQEVRPACFSHPIGSRLNTLHLNTIHT